MMKKNIWAYVNRTTYLPLLMLVVVLNAYAHEIADDEQSKNRNTADSFDLYNFNTGKAAKFDIKEVGVDEKLGQYLPLRVSFNDENNAPIDIGNFIDRPTLILPVFFHCPQECSILLANLAMALNDVSFAPGSEYKVLAISFDKSEVSADAVLAKKDYLKLLRPNFPLESWKFLTGSEESIQALTQALGFHFKEIKEHDFVHPNVLVSVAPDGKIIRYLYGPYFLPFDISMAIAEAQKGTPEISIKKLVSYCYSYDPVGKKYVFKLFQLSGAAIMGLLAFFLFFLLRKKQPSDRTLKGA